MCIAQTKRLPNLEVNSPFIRAELALKLPAERRMARALSRFFEALSTDFTETYMERGVIIDPMERIPALSRLLKTEMSRTAMVFKSQIRDDMKSNIVYETKDMTGDEVDALNEYDFQIQSEDQAHTILKNASKLQTAAVAAAIAFLLLENIQPTPELIGSAAGAKVGSKLSNRVGTIATTETQFAAERAKANEASVLSRSTTAVIAGVVGVLAVFEKEWNTVLDEKTRTSHAFADGQRRPLKQPFVVQGQSLMHPRDASMGASADNIINCRCSSRITVKRS